MNICEKQEDEIKTIRKRKIEIKLSNADVERVSKLAGSHGITIEELLENFIGDLVDGTYTNGSSERDIAEQWFRRCWFGMFPDDTFLHFLIEYDYIDDALEYWKNISEHEEYIKKIEEELATGVIKSWDGDDYTWKELMTSSADGTRPSYASKEEWEKVREWNEHYLSFIAK